jgi:peptidoglycan/xylan/chitin deacetylase (PgdA/CDA1 family)
MKGYKKRYLPGILCAAIYSFLVGCNHAHGRDGDGQVTPVIGVKKPVADKFAWHPVVYDSTKEYIYLTFDDGPQHGTVDCFELCRKEGVKASFFMVGLHSAQKSDGRKIVAMIKDGYPQFLLANHSYTHAKDKYAFFYHHPQMAEQDFLQAQDSLHVPFKIVRLPGNSAWAEKGDIRASGLVRPVTRLLDSAGYNVIGWDLEWNFRHKNARPVQTPEKLAAQIDSAFAKHKIHTRNHLVILSHDRMFQRPGDLDSLARFITILKHNPKYVFETVDHYPGIKISH